MAVSLFSASAFARDPGPESGPQIDSIERARADGPRLAEACGKLTAEVNRLYELRTEFELLKNVGESGKRQITLPGSSTLVHDRIQELKREIRQREAANPNDPALTRLREEHNRLHDSYVAQMNARIAEWSGLPSGVRDYATLVERYGAAKQKWEPQQSRYPQAREEKERICEQSRRAEALIASGSCDVFNHGAQAPAQPRIAADTAMRGSSPILNLLGITPAHAIGTAPGEIAAYANGVLGLACVKPRGRSAWSPLQQGQSVEVGDTVRTGKDGRVRLVFADRDERANAGPSVMNFAPETEMVIERFTIRLDDPPHRDGYFDLIRGKIRAFMKGWGSSSSVNVRAGVAICGIRGTEFVLSHAPVTSQVDLKVAEGKVEFSTPQGKTVVGAGQMAAAKGPALGPVRTMPANVWKQAQAATEVKATVTTKPAPIPPGKVSVAPKPAASTASYTWGCTGQQAPCRMVLFEGRHYETAYHRITNSKGQPVDTYYYPVQVDGRPVSMGAGQLWNHFAQVLAGDDAGFYHDAWVLEDGKWHLRTHKVERFDPLGVPPHEQTRQSPGQTRSPPAAPPAGR